jgi:hypothetical protein
MMEQLPRTGYGFTEREHYDEFRQLIYDDIVEKQQPMTVRQVFYRAVVKNYVEKTEKGYGYVQRDLVQMRRDGKMSYEWIIDASRHVRGMGAYEQPSMEGFIERRLESIPDGWSRELTTDHDISVQVWLEKEALAGIVGDIVLRWDVPLYCAKGYSSLTFIHEAAQDLERQAETFNRGARIFFFGDYDPSGQDAIATVQRDLSELAPRTAELGLEFVIVAVTPEQITEMNLPTRPTKRTDTRAAGFGNESVELDAIEPDVLRILVSQTMEQEFGEGAREALEQRVETECKELRKQLRKMLKKKD